MRDQDVKALIAYRLEEAAEALADAELLLHAGGCRSAANRLYYAAFYAAVAVLLTKRQEYSKHSGVIAFFDKEFICRDCSTVAGNNERKRFAHGGKGAVWQASCRQGMTGLVKPVILGGAMLM